MFQTEDWCPTDMTSICVMFWIGFWIRKEKRDNVGMESVNWVVVLYQY